MSYSKQNGFTLIELVVVIVLLGILGVTALGKFQNMSDEAHNSAVQGHLAQFSSAAMAARFKNQVETDGDPLSVTLQSGVTLAVNDQGWPGSPFDASACMNLWQNLMTSNMPITIWDGDVDSLDSTGEGWEVAGSGVFCTYIYKPDVTPLRYITYLPANSNATDGRIYASGI